MSRKDHFIMKLINLLIRELKNCSLGGNFRVSHYAEICQFDCFSLEIDFKRAHSCNYGIPQTGLKLKNYTIHYDSLETLQLHCAPVLLIIVYCKKPITTLRNVCAVHWGESLSTPGVFSTLGDGMSTSGGFSTLGDTMISVGDIMSTLGDVQ